MICQKFYEISDDELIQLLENDHLRDGSSAVYTALDNYLYEHCRINENMNTSLDRIIKANNL